MRAGPESPALFVWIQVGWEVDAFCSFVKKSGVRLEAGRARRTGWARSGDA